MIDESGTSGRWEALAKLLACLGIAGHVLFHDVLPAALTAILEGRTTTVSPTAFDFISSTSQIGDVRIFMRKLRDVLHC